MGDQTEPPPGHHDSSGTCRLPQRQCLLYIWRGSSASIKSDSGVFDTIHPLHLAQRCRTTAVAGSGRVRAHSKGPGGRARRNPDAKVPLDARGWYLQTLPGPTRDSIGDLVLLDSAREHLSGGSCLHHGKPPAPRLSGDRRQRQTLVGT